MQLLGELLLTRQCSGADGRNARETQYILSDEPLRWRNDRVSDANIQMKRRKHTGIETHLNRVTRATVWRGIDTSHRGAHTEGKAILKITLNRDL